jgi:hypothetical protein
MHHNGLLRGPKFSGNHTTVIDSAIPAIKAARDCVYVTKVGIGIIDQAKQTSNARIKFTLASGGVKMIIRGTNAVQTFWVYTTDPTNAIAEIKAKWDSQ